MGGELSKQRRENILEVDSHTSKQVYRNQEGFKLPALEWIYHIPSSIKREWQKMSKAEKIVYGTILLSTAVGLGIAADYKYNDGKTVKWTKDKADKGAKFVKEKYANAFAPAPAAVVAPMANDTMVQPTATPQKHVFTPDLKVYGSPEYQQKVQKSLDELNKTPDSFRINGMTAYEYATYWLDELYEGEERETPPYAPPGVEYMPKNLISASNLIHISNHIEQGKNESFHQRAYRWRLKGESVGLLSEYDAVRLQVSWEKVGLNNLTDEEAIRRFNYAMKYYTNDSKYFAKSFPPPDLI